MIKEINRGLIGKVQYYCSIKIVALVTSILYKVLLKANTNINIFLQVCLS